MLCAIEDEVIVVPPIEAGGHRVVVLQRVVTTLVEVVNDPCHLVGTDLDLVTSAIIVRVNVDGQVARSVDVPSPAVHVGVLTVCEVVYRRVEVCLAVE